MLLESPAFRRGRMSIVRTKPVKGGTTGERKAVIAASLFLSQHIAIAEDAGAIGI